MASTTEGTEERAGSATTRIVRAWRSLAPERRLAAAAGLGLCLALFLPWYEETGFASGGKRLLHTNAVSLTGWHAFSWVEAAVLLVALSVLALLYLRAEGRAFHLPGGDGFVVILAGAWTCLLLIWRIFDNQTTTAHNQFGTTFGIKWGIFVALGLALLMVYAGTRIRAAHQPEPPLPGEEPGADGWRWDTPPPASRRRRPAPARVAVEGAPAVAVQGGPPGANARGAAQARKTRRAVWAEPVAWEGSGEAPFPFDPGGPGRPGGYVFGRDADPDEPTRPLYLVDPAGDAETLSLFDPSDATQPMHLVDPTDATEPMRVVDPTDATEPMRVVDPTDATEPLRVVDPSDATEPLRVVDATDATEPLRVVDPTDATEPLRVVDPTDATEPMPDPDATDPTEPRPPRDAAETDATLPLGRAQRYDARRPPHTKAT